MATNTNNPTRRQALAGIALCGVAAAAPAASLAASSQPVDRQAWDRAVALHEAKATEANRIGDLVTAAHDRAGAECPRRNEFFSRYNMGHGWSSDRNFSACRMSLVIERAKGSRLTPAEAKQVTIDAQRIVEEFEAYGLRHQAAFAEYDRLQTQFDCCTDEQSEAFRVMLATPAPDGEALQYKIEALSKWLTEGLCDGADSLAAINADASRLLTPGAA